MYGLITFRNILIIYNLLNTKYINDITDYFKFNRNKTTIYFTNKENQ